MQPSATYFLGSLDDVIVVQVAQCDPEIECDLICHILLASFILSSR